MERLGWASTNVVIKCFPAEREAVIKSANSKLESPDFLNSAGLGASNFQTWLRIGVAWTGSLLTWTEK